ncbi:MAG: phage tail tape measure protein [Limosilactobacillus fermentum]|nr:MAG: phage tail tape measure protein [Limosilactobacillus fermentum]
MSLESVFKLSLIMNMIDNLTGPMAGVQSSVGNSVSKLEGMNQTLGNITKTGAVMAGVGAQITDAALAPVQATFATRKAIGELSSLGVKDLRAVEDAAKSFSDQWSGTTKSDFITAAYDIKSGIASLSDEGVADMTSLAALTGKATKSTAAEMTSLFATGYGIYKDYYNDLSDMEFGEMFSAGIAKSVQQFKTTGSGMAQSIQTLGGSATTANVPLEEQLSILGMLQATMGGAEAGTKYKAFLRSAVKGGEELGLKFTDTNNQLLSMPEILDKLRGKFGETMDAAEKVELQKAFGDTEAVALIDLMYNKVGDLQDNIVGMYDSLGSGAGVAREMASAMQETEPERFERLTQRIQNVKESIGNSLLPTVNDLMGKGEQLLSKVATWIEDNQELVRVIMLVVLAIGGFLTVAGTTIAVVGGVGLVLSETIGFVGGFYRALKKIPDLLDTVHIMGLYAGDGIKKGFSVIKTAGSTAITGIKNVAINIASMAKTAAISGVTALKNMTLGLVGMAKQAITTAVTALPGLIAGVWSFTAALLANPITWIIIAIIALVAAILLLWQNWDFVTAWLRSAWDTCCNAVSAGIQRLQSGFQAFLGFFQSIGQGIAQGMGFIRQGFNNVITWIQGKFSWFGEAGKRLITTFVGGIKSMAMAPVNAVKNIFDKIKNLFPHSDAKEGPLSTLTLSGQRTMTTFADGVTLAQDAPAKAIEKGFQKVDGTLIREPAKKVKIGGEPKQNSDDDEGSRSGSEKNVIIQKLLMQVDVKKIKDLQLLFSLLKEVEDYTNANGGEVGTDAQPEPA